MGPLRFDLLYKKNEEGFAQRENPNATFQDRGNDAVFIFYEGSDGEYIRFRLADPASRLALSSTAHIAGRRSPRSTREIRVDNGDFAELHLRRRLGISSGGGPIFGQYSISLEDAGPDPDGGGDHIPLDDGGGPGGADLVVEC